MCSHGWGLASASVQGARHRRQSLPNQDAVAWGGGVSSIVALADGHGHPTSFRSHLGSKFAAAIAVQVLARGAERTVASRLMAAWREAVATHLHLFPFTNDELDSLARQTRGDVVPEVLLDPALAYGTTLIAAKISSEGAFLLELGDGNMVAIDDAGHLLEPLTEGPHVGTTTTSLCRPGATADIRTTWVRAPLALIWLSTDGFADSFPGRGSFHAAVRDYERELEERGLDKVRERLSAWLLATSNRGSGDDITVAILYREATEQSECQATEERPASYSERALPDHDGDE